MPTGFVKSTIQAPGEASARTRSAISSTTGTVRMAFAKPPAPVVSWPMQPQARGAVSSRNRASAADSDLNQHEVGVRNSAVEIAGHLEPTRIALARQHPPSHASDHIAPPRIDVVQHEFVGVESGQPGDELRGVGGSAADDRDLHSG